MTDSRHMKLQRIHAEHIDEQLYNFVMAASPGKKRPNLAAAIDIAQACDGLIVDRQAAEEAVYHAVFWAAVSAESNRQRNNIRRLGREIYAKRSSQLENMKALHKELQNDATLAPWIKGQESDSSHIEDYSELIGVVQDLDKAIMSLEGWISKQSENLRGRGGNIRYFEIAYVKAIREVWKHLTGVDPGISRSVVVQFATALWSAFDFSHPKTRPLDDWLGERFNNIR